MRSSAPSLRYLTVVTYGRTGSTALQSALNALPGVLVRGENYGAFRGLHDYVQALSETADRHHSGRPTHPWFGSAKLDVDTVVSGLRDQVLATVLRPSRTTRWVGFKEVRYEPGHFADYDLLLEYLLFLDKLFPGIVYLMNVRSPELAAQSGWWPEHGDAAAVLKVTRERLERAVRDLTAALGPQRAILLDYDAWARRPEELMAGLSGLGLPRDDAAVREALATRLPHGRHAVDDDDPAVDGGHESTSVVETES
jgi:hypothetical protein